MFFQLSLHNPHIDLSQIILKKRCAVDVFKHEMKYANNQNLSQVNVLNYLLLSVALEEDQTFSSLITRP